MGCHPKETGNYLRSPMGRSLGPPEHSVPPGKVAHAQSGSSINVSWRNGRMMHHLSELGLTAEYGITYQVGAGLVGHTYLSAVGGVLLESPVSYYKAFGWDISPGYDNSEMLDFDRVVGVRCLFCHSNRVQSQESPLPAQTELGAISCDRCHGSATEHLRRPVPGSIVNPAKLSAGVRDSVCEQCHLEGVARVLNPGRTLRDYSPGDELEQTLAIYVLKENHSSDVAVSQAEQLATSRCSIASAGKLWCGTCHDPHDGARSMRKAEVKAICSGCHARLSTASHPASVSECSSCHMPRLAPRDVAHAATTDHRILAHPSSRYPAVTASERDAQAWREPPAESRRRDLALAELEAARNPLCRDLGVKGERELNALPAGMLENDAGALAALASVRLSENNAGAAVELLRRATQIEPPNASLAFHLGSAAAKQNGETKEAIDALRRCIELDPSFEQAYGVLASIYNRKGDLAEAKHVRDLYLEWNRQSILGRIARENLDVLPPLPQSR